MSLKKNIEYINYNNNNKRNIKKGKENKMKMFQFWNKYSIDNKTTIKTKRKSITWSLKPSQQPLLITKTITGNNNKIQTHTRKIMMQHV